MNASSSGETEILRDLLGNVDDVNKIRNQVGGWSLNRFFLFGSFHERKSLRNCRKGRLFFMLPRPGPI